MGPRRIAFCLFLAGLLVCPTPAEALDRVVGDGFGYVVPGPFQPAPRKMRERTEKLCVEIASQIPLRFNGRPAFRMFIVPDTAEAPEAFVASYTFTLSPGQTQPLVTTVPLAKLESGLILSLSSLPEARLTGTVHRTIGSEVLSAVSTVSYEHKEAGGRTLRVALCADGHVACLLLFDTPTDRDGAYRMHWDGIVGSLRLGTAAHDGSLLTQYLPILGIALGVLLLLIFVYVGHMRRKRHGRLQPLDDGGFRGNTISDLKGSRAVDGLEIFDQEEPPPREAPVPPPVVPAPAPEAPSVPATPLEAAVDEALDFDIPSRDFDATRDSISGAGITHAGPTSDRPAPKRVERKVLSSSPRKGDGEGDEAPKIVRNDEYLKS